MMERDVNGHGCDLRFEIYDLRDFLFGRVLVANPGAEGAG
jgi:hypothetical protein